MARRHSPRIASHPSELWIGDPVRDAGYVLLESRYAIPRRFRAAAWPIEGHRVHLAIEVDDSGAPSCRELKLEPLEQSGHVTAATLRAVAIDKLMRLAVAEAMQEGDLQADGAFEPQERTTSAGRDAFYERYRRGARRPRRGSPLTDENLQQVAELYRAAVKRGDPPTETVSEQLHIARSTAGRWVAAARKRGLLGPATRGKGGER